MSWRRPGMSLTSILIWIRMIDKTGKFCRVIGYGAKEETKDIITSVPASPIAIDTRWFPCTITNSTEE